MSRPATAVEFSGNDRGPVLDEMRALAETRGGWVNLSPRVDPDLLPPPQSSLVTMFSARGPRVPLATWVPGRADGRRPEASSLGLQHPLGTKARPTLADLGLTEPAGYRVVSDHAKRGVVLESRDPGDPDEVLDWMVRATGGTCPIEFDGWWIAGIVPR